MNRLNPAKLRLAAALVLAAGVSVTCTEQPPTESDQDAPTGPSVSVYVEGQAQYVKPPEPRLFATTFPCDGSESVLLIQDVSPWAAPGSAEGGIVDELAAQGLDFCIINSSDVGTADLTDFPVVIIAAAQTQAFYDNIFPIGTIHSDITAYVQGGGILSANLTDNASGPGFGGNWDGDVFVGGVKHENSFVDDNSIADATHPIVTNALSCASGNCGVIVDNASFVDLDDWNSSSHGYFTNLPAGTKVILSEAASSEPVMIEYNYGEGVVIATQTTAVWRYVGGIPLPPPPPPLPVNKKLLANEIAYQMYIAFAIKVTVTDGTNPLAGQVVTAISVTDGPFRPDGSLLIDLTDANGMVTFRGLWPGGWGVHARDLISTSNATVNGTLIAPGLTPLQSGPNAPAILLSNPGWETLVDADQYFDMLDNPPIVLSFENPRAEVTLEMEQFAAVLAQLLDPNGFCLDAFVGIVELRRSLVGPLGQPEGSPPPWSTAQGLSGDDIPAVLAATAPSDVDCNVSLTSLPGPNPLTLLLQSTIDPDGFSVTDFVDDTDLGTLVATPNQCTQDRFPEDQGDPQIGNTDFLDVFFGVEAQFDANGFKIPKPTWFIYWDQLYSNGPFELHVRGRTVLRKRFNKIWKFSCTNGDNCQLLTESSDGLPAEFFFAPTFDADNRVQVTAILGMTFDGVEISTAEFQLTSGGQQDFKDDVVPNGSRGGRKWIELPTGVEKCVPPTGENILTDPRLWIGH